MWTLLGMCRPQGSHFELKWSILWQISVANGLIFYGVSVAKGIFSADCGLIGLFFKSNNKILAKFDLFCTNLPQK